LKTNYPKYINNSFVLTEKEILKFLENEDIVIHCKEHSYESITEYTISYLCEIMYNNNVLKRNKKWYDDKFVYTLNHTKQELLKISRLQKIKKINENN